MHNPSLSDDAPSSAKAAGKRPAILRGSLANTPEPPTPLSAPEGKSAVQTRQKRVLPSRSRRGGPGVGSCDIDLMILETRRRRLENEPLIPSSTKFLLTTNSKLVPPSSDNTTFEIELNKHAYGRYFDRPEVQKAYREQQIIQTPEFSQLPEEAIVGGRFRPRGSEEEATDTSDAAYEKRHKKYETFEKRQRLREKEKLKHEQYKLKERIEQLRAMDTSAFLAVPASAFSDSAGPVVLDVHDTDNGVADLPGAHVNGAAAYNEGERRRKEMLDIALSLEERYRVLLPPDRKWSEKKDKGARQERQKQPPTTVAGHNPIPEPEVATYGEVQGEQESEREPDRPRAPSPVTLEHRQDSDGESEVDPEERDRLRSKQLKLRIRFPPRPPPATESQPPIITPVKKSSGGKPQRGGGKTLPQWFSAIAASAISPETITSPSATKKPNLIIRSKDGKFLPKEQRYLQSESISALPPRKRSRADSSVSQGQSPSHPKSNHISYAGAAGKTERTTCALLVSALRNSTAPSVRKTQRHLTAFGVRVPQELEDVRDFELPEWLLNPTDEDGRSSVYGNGATEYSGVAANESAEPSLSLDVDLKQEETTLDIPPIATLE
ncbi:hypothetical protein K474DRAFT_1739813 [Panus rudis PR-1116 ss-1]|nr:hypothetical protein K474DRAFT_1739813 [Panus rudis PR-1116 ss-1]